MNLQEIAPILEEIIKETLEEKRYPYGFQKYKGISNKVATGRLRDSVQVVVAQDTQSRTVLKVIMVEYAKYVQSGRLGGQYGNKKGGGKGDSPFILSLIDWIKARKIRGRNAYGRYITNRSLAYAIRTNIFKYGIRASNFYDISIEKVLEDPRIKDLLEGKPIEDLINAIEGL